MPTDIMKRSFFLIVILGLLSSMALAAADGPAILKSIEDRLMGAQAPQDLQATMTMTIKRGGSVKTREIRAWSKNNADRDDSRVLKFVSPADVKDVGFLVLAEDSMYIYLPEFHRVRRIASSNKRDSFMDSDFSYEDMGTGGYSKYYDSKVASETDKTWVLELTKKPDAEKPYGKILLTVDKGNGLPVRMEAFDAAGRLWKTSDQTASRVGQYWIMTSYVMTDLKKNSTTTLEMKDLKPDQKLADDIFSERFLVRRVL